MPLPPAYRWADDQEGGACLFWNYGFVASIKPDGTTKLKHWHKEFHSKAASVAQAKRFIERWLNARSSPRALECAQWRGRYAKVTALKSPARRREDEFIYRKLLGTNASASSSRLIKVDNLLPDDFESIADVGEPLEAFWPHADASKIRRRRMLVMPSVG